MISWFGLRLKPLLVVTALGLSLAWKIAGYIGLDAYILSGIGNRDSVEAGLRLAPPAR